MGGLVMDVFFIVISILIGFMFTIFALNDIKIELRYRNILLEKQNETGNISYDGDNHELMTHLRQEKVDTVANNIPLQTIDTGAETGDLLILGWGGTYGALKTATTILRGEGLNVSHAHVRYINPFPKNLGDILRNFKTVVVPELNNGQLVKIIRDKYFVDAIPYNKIQGQPFMSDEVVRKIKEILA